MAMAATFLLHSKPPWCSALPCRLSTVLLLGRLLLSCSHPISGPCFGSQQDPSGNLTVSGAFDNLPGYLFLTNMSTCRTNWDRVDCRGLGPYMKTKHPAFDLSQKGWFFVRQHIVLLQNRYADRPDEASFSVVFTMSIYQPNNQTKAANGASLVFAVEPLFFPFDSWGIFTPPNWQVLGPSSSSNPSSSTDSAGGHVTAEIGTARDNGMLLYLGDIVWVQIGIDPSGNYSSVAAAREYSVWIDYDHIGHRMSVYADAGEDALKPANAIASKNLTISAQFALLGLFSSMGQLLQVHTWNSTVDGLPGFQDTGGIQDRTVMLLSVLGSVAATAITTALVLLYLNSKYRRWKKEQDELAKIMQGIPGVPAHVDFARIKKATNNFHETAKLGKGGFGAVYRCKLPPAEASRRGAMDVAVKKFTRQVEDHRCSDFIAEVSIINRLRHKNIVPLIGWSYNKGEAILIYEYMTNGSLDQHLFQKHSPPQQQQQEEDGDTSLRQWHTRYAIARDIATGLHYVHHEHEPMVLHRDIKASNIMLHSDFRGRLGDFGIACTVAGNRSSVTGMAGTWGYIAPDYAMSYRATRQTDIYAFGVLLLEIVTGKKNGDMDIPSDDDESITDWIWRLHGEGKLLDAVDGGVLVVAGGGGDQQDDEARRLLLLGLACTNPNPSDRPGMAEARQVITKVMPPPDVPPEKPAFVWPPRDWRSRNSVYSTAGSDWERDGSLATSMEQPLPAAAEGLASVRSRATCGSHASTNAGTIQIP